jgi:hypothetical protein
LSVTTTRASTPSSASGARCRKRSSACWSVDLNQDVQHRPDLFYGAPQPVSTLVHPEHHLNRCAIRAASDLAFAHPAAVVKGGSTEPAVYLQNGRCK